LSDPFEIGFSRGRKRGLEMENNEMIALGIVALAAFLALRYFFGKKGGGCCGSDCLPEGRTKFEKKEKLEKSKDVSGGK